MPLKPVKKTDFEKLKDLWYEKLRKTGWKDIEQDEDNLKRWETSSNKHRRPGLWESTEAYYQMATNFLNDYTFSDNVEKIIWEYHSEGISIRDIVVLLRKAKIRKKFTRQSIWLILERLTKSMKSMYLTGYQGKFDD